MDNGEFDSPEYALDRPVAGAESGAMPLAPDERWRHVIRVGVPSGALSAPEVVHAARAVIADRDATIAGLQAQLDGYQGRTVYFTTDANLGYSADQIPGAGRGTILRATDTGRELVCEGDGVWRERD